MKYFKFSELGTGDNNISMDGAAQLSPSQLFLVHIIYYKTLLFYLFYDTLHT